MARDGWSLKDAGAVLHVHPNKVTQAMTPAFLKVAKLMMHDPLRTWIELLLAMEQVEQDLIRAKLKQSSIMPTSLKRQHGSA